MEGYILLLPNAYRDENLVYTTEIYHMLTEQGFETRISPFLYDAKVSSWPQELPIVSLEEGIRNARLFVTLGGDGTILQISRYIAGTGVPVIGINLGHKGFLTEMERNEAKNLLRAAAGQYTVEERMMLDVHLMRGGECVFSTLALNEAIVRALTGVIRLEAFGDGREITAFSGDGIIVATPTGSTAYSMAAGGPIVEPSAECLILTPICAFRLAARSYILNQDIKVTIRIDEQNEKKAILYLDGLYVDFLDGDELQVSCSEKRLLMAHFSEHSFYDVVFEKLTDKD